jgi:hypothetical protein
MNQSAQSAGPPAKARAAAGWTFAAFRAWREREHPQSSYQIGPHVWWPERSNGAVVVEYRINPAMKNWEPRLTGFAYSDSDVYLVEVAAVLSAEHIGRLLYLVDLWRRDPDYLQHRNKRVHVVAIVREATDDLIAFARRRRIRVVLLCADTEADVLG